MALEGSEEEQVEALKKWWSENGKSLMLGVSLGLAAVGGWQYWLGHQVDVAKQASSAYQALLVDFESGADGNEQALQKAQAIRSQFPDSSYATLASMAGAAVNLRSGNIDLAKQDLQWVIENTKQSEFKYVASERLARLALNENDPEAASKILGDVAPDGFGGIYGEIQGDIFVAQGDYAAAAEAYKRALQNDVVNARLVKMKMDDLGMAQ